MIAFRKSKRRVSDRVVAFCRAAGVDCWWEAARVHASRAIEEYEGTIPALDVWKLCATHHIEIQTAHLEDCDARLIPVRSGYIAEIHSEHAKGRQNFSLCHEFAHTIFDSATRKLGGDVALYGDCRDALEERLCHAVASELLMPREIFTREARGTSPNWGEVRRLAEVFQVSKEAAVYRVQKLNIWESITVQLRICSDGAHDRLKIEWIQPAKSLETNPMATALLVHRVLEHMSELKNGALKSGANSRFELDDGRFVSTSWECFSVDGARFARVLISRSRLCPERSFDLMHVDQLPLFHNLGERQVN